MSLPVEIPADYRRPPQAEVLRRLLPTPEDIERYERAVVAHFAAQGHGLNRIKRVFAHRTKDEVRRMMPRV